MQLYLYKLAPLIIRDNDIANGPRPTNSPYIVIYYIVITIFHLYSSFDVFSLALNDLKCIPNINFFSRKWLTESSYEKSDVHLFFGYR